MTEFIFRARPWAIMLLQHNWLVLVYGLLVVLVAILAYIRPGRRLLLTLYGLLGLIFAFEYHKHIAPALSETARYLFSVEVNPSARLVSQSIISEALPVAFHLLALALLVGAAAPWRWRLGREGEAGIPAGVEPGEKA
jgi:hypothetical protein